MSKTFSNKVVVKKKGTDYTIALAITDKALVVSELTERELRVLRKDIEKLLKEVD